MSRSLLFLTCSLFCLFRAAPLRAESPDAPHYLVQIQPAGRLLKTVKEFARKYAAPQLGDKAKEKTSSEIEQELADVLGKDWRDAIDENKPILLSGRISETARECLPIVMLPVKSERVAREHLKQRGVRLEESVKGCQKCVIPGLDLPVHVRFAGGYLYASFVGAEALAEERLLAPAKLLDPMEKAAVAARLHIDRLPQALRDKFADAGNDKVREGLQGVVERLPEPVKEASRRLGKQTEGWIKAIARHGKELVVRLDLDPATGELKEFVELTPQPGSALAMLLAGVRQGPSLGAALAGGKSAGELHARLALPEDLSGLLLTQARQIVKQALDKVEDDKAREAFSAAAQSLEPTLKAGVLDAALVLHGPSRDKRYGAVLAIQLKDGLAVEKAAKKLIGFLPAKNPLRLLALDTDTIGGVKVHRYPLGELVPPMLQEPFGKGPVTIAFRKDGVLAAWGEGADEHLGRALAMKLRQAPPLLLRADGDAKGLADLIVRGYRAEGAKKDGEIVAKGVEEEVRKFADLFEGRLRVMDLSLSGGQTLRMSYSINLVVLPRTAAAKPAPKKQNEK
jgi:hypothetical protein